MERHVDDQLPEYLLGTLGEEDHHQVARHLSRCTACARLHAQLHPATRLLAASVPPRAPSPHARERLLSFIRGEGRFADFVPDVARLFDLAPATAGQLLARLEEPGEWHEGPVPGVTLMPVTGGPRVEGALTAFVRLSPGRRFPTHTHGGEELTFVLQGGFREDSGREVWPGECLEKQEGTTHGFVAVNGPDCITAAVVRGELLLKEEVP